MNVKNHHLLYFGLVTVAIEVFALMVGLSILGKNFNADIPISTVSTGDKPLPMIYGVTLTLIAITYFLFSLPLKSYSKYMPVIAAIAGVAFTFTGWIPYGGEGGSTDLAHHIFSLIALAGYIGMVWLLRKHPKEHVSKVSKVTYKFMLIGVVFAFFSYYALGKYVAFAQFYLLLLLQGWTVFIVWQELKKTQN